MNFMLFLRMIGYWLDGDEAAGRITPETADARRGLIIHWALEMERDGHAG